MESPATEFVLNGPVSYWSVDREQALLLRSFFEFLQEAAIKHADQADSGTRAKAMRGETWVLRRIAATVQRYPRYEEQLKVVTWSTCIRAFKGFRDFRVYCGDELIASASSIWLYFSLANKALCRVPKEVAARFPSRPGDSFCPDLEKLPLAPPLEGAPNLDITLRYSDVDGNSHVNNTAYLDYLQTALARGGFAPRPCHLQVEFLKEIPPTVPSIAIALEKRSQAIAFGITGPAGLSAHGLVA
jgi:acyl-ACP thioesterase